MNDVNVHVLWLLKRTGGKCKHTGGKCKHTGGKCKCTGGKCKCTGGKCKCTEGKYKCTGGKCNFLVAGCGLYTGELWCTILQGADYTRGITVYYITGGGLYTGNYGILYYSVPENMIKLKTSIRRNL